MSNERIFDSLTMVIRDYKLPTYNLQSRFMVKTQYSVHRSLSAARRSYALYGHHDGGPPMVARRSRLSTISASPD